jgi:alpha-amylase/alpha-mannosidase (GH57 family)
LKPTPGSSSSFRSIPTSSRLFTEPTQPPTTWPRSTFTEKQYENVIELLREVEYENVTYALGGKLMLLKTYYELDELTPLDSLLDSFRIYLRRNQLISREIKQQYLNVLRIVKRMAQVAPYDRKAIEKLRNQVDKSNSLADKNWILAKLKELEGK